MCHECYEDLFNSFATSFREDAEDEAVETAKIQSVRIGTAMQMLRKGSPEMVRAFAISAIDSRSRTIVFHTNEDIAHSLKRFGHLDPGAWEEVYVLIVDPRYNFTSVLEWLKGMEVIYDGGN